MIEFYLRESEKDGATELPCFARSKTKNYLIKYL